MSLQRVARVMCCPTQRHSSASSAPAARQHPTSILLAVLCPAACVATDCCCRDKYMKFILEDRKFIILDKNQASHRSDTSPVQYTGARRTEPDCALSMHPPRMQYLVEQAWCIAEPTSAVALQARQDGPNILEQHAITYDRSADLRAATSAVRMAAGEASCGSLSSRLLLLAEGCLVRKCCSFLVMLAVCAGSDVEVGVNGLAATTQQ